MVTKKDPTETTEGTEPALDPTEAVGEVREVKPRLVTEPAFHPIEVAAPDQTVGFTPISVTPIDTTKES